MQPQELIHPTPARLWSDILTLMGPFRFPVGRDTWNGWVWEGSRSSEHCGMCRWGRNYEICRRVRRREWWRWEVRVCEYREGDIMVMGRLEG